MTRPEATAQKVRRVVIVGLPNSGKSTLFNALTGEYDLVANYPMTTVEVKRKECGIEGRPFEIVDTPGLHGLFIQSEEEMVVRSLLFQETSDLFVQCMDANRLKESLVLTADLLDLGVPLVLYVTAVREGANRGTAIDAPALSRALGVPVVESTGPGKAVAEVTRAILSPPPAARAVEIGSRLEQAVHRVEATLPAGSPFPRASALLLLEGDPSFPIPSNGNGAEARTELSGIQAGFAGKAGLLMSSQRSHWVDRVAESVVSHSPRPKSSFSESFASLCRHPIYGLPMLALFLVLVYLLVVQGAGTLSLLLTTAVTDPVVRAVSHILPVGFWRDLLVGPRGLLTLGLFNSLTTVLPVLSLFFLLFGLMEDIGYLPNLTILTRRAFGKIGLSGGAIIPIVLGFGCKTMATMTARSIPSRREKLIAVALIAFAIPCSAQMGLSMAILGQHGFRYFFLAFLVLGLAEVAVGFLLNKLLPKGPKDRFIQELPPIRLPSLVAVGKKTGYRLLWFLKEAIPIFILAAFVLFVIDRIGILGLLKDALRPLIVGRLGLPLDMVDALLLTLARSEAGAGLILRMSHSGVLNGVQSIVAVVLLTTFSQCFANIGAMLKELGARVGLTIVASIYVAAFLVAGATHALLGLLSGVLKL
ncbi:MAG TPA: ferrous iron transporter B [Spirochaetia bacterium]|nr:ferrous iron transporter B [Spirochaetia bacterium]